MFAAGYRNFQFGMMLATGLSFSILPTAGWAYTQDEQQACSGDAFRLCSAEIPDVDRVTVCMIRNKSQLSPECQVYFRPEPEVAPVATGRPLSIKPGASRKPAAAKSAGTKPQKPRKPVKPAT